MSRPLNVNIGHEFKVRRADSYWPRSIYRSVNFSQVMNSLGAQLTAWRASLTAHSNFPFERRKSHCVWRRVWDWGVSFIALDIICTALTSSSDIGLNHTITEESELDSLMPIYALASNDATSGSRAAIFSKRLAAGWYLPLSPKYLNIPAVRWFETTDATCISGSEPTCHPTMRWEAVKNRASSNACLYRRGLQLPVGNVIRLQA